MNLTKTCSGLGVTVILIVIKMNGILTFEVNFSASEDEHRPLTLTGRGLQRLRN